MKSKTESVPGGNPHAVKPDVERRFLSVAEFAAAVGLSQVETRRWLKRGVIPSIQPAGPRGRILIPRKTLDALAEAALQKAPLNANARDRKSADISGPAPRWLRRHDPHQT